MSQIDSDGDGFGNACDGDINNTGTVDLLDWLVVLLFQGSTAGNPSHLPAADMDADGSVGLSDLLTVSSDLNKPPGPGPDSPESCTAPDPTVALFDPEHVVEIEIVLPGAQWDELRFQHHDMLEALGENCVDGPPPKPYDWFRATVTIDGTTLHDVGVRKKGFIGSNDWIRPSLKIDFSEFVDGQRYAGKHKLTLNNSRQDFAFMRQCLVQGLHTAAGLPVSRCNFAHVTVNGVDKGVFVNLEDVNDQFMVRNFGTANGNQYEGSNSDFKPLLVNTFEAENSANGDDLQALTATLADAGAGWQAIGQHVDLLQYLRFWSMEGLIGSTDGYANHANNFRLYGDPGRDGRFVFIPWGFDMLLGSESEAGTAAETSAIFVNAALPQRLYDLPYGDWIYALTIYDLLENVWDEAALNLEIDRMHSLISPYAGDISSEVAVLREWIDSRREAVFAQFSAGPPPVASSPTGAVCIAVTGTVNATFDTFWLSPLTAIPNGTVTGELIINEGRYAYHLSSGERERAGLVARRGALHCAHHNGCGRSGL